jgi:hypothetical protein
LSRLGETTCDFHGANPFTQIATNSTTSLGSSTNWLAGRSHDA